MSEESEVIISGGGDGILGTTLELTVINPFVYTDVFCNMDFTEDEVQVLLKGIIALQQMSEFTDVTKEEMIALALRFMPYLED